jgi:hypothetical protein
MFHEALNSLRKDAGRSFFCWLTYFLTTMYIFLFFTISLSSSIGVTLFDEHTTSMTYLMIFGILICALEIFYANDFYVRNQAKELAVMSVCGASLKQLAFFLLIQTVVLFLTALPPGILCGTALMPFLNLLSSETGLMEQITLNHQAVISTAVVLGSVIFWMTFVNLAFVYRSSSASLLNPQTLILPKEKIFALAHRPKAKTKALLSILLFLGPAAGFLLDPEALPFFALISLFGMNQCMDTVLMPLLEKRIEAKIEDPVAFTALGFVRRDMKILRENLVLLIGTLTVLLAMLAGKQSAEAVLILLTLAAMDLLLCLGLLFRFSSEVSGRTSAFHTLDALGFLSTQTKAVRQKEVHVCYGIVFAILIFYTGFMAIGLCTHGLVSLSALIWITAAGALPLVLTSILSERWYERWIS